MHVCPHCEAKLSGAIEDLDGVCPSCGKLLVKNELEAEGGDCSVDSSDVDLIADLREAFCR